MKKLFFLTLLSAIAGIAVAQQSLQAPTEVRYTTINPDHTVTVNLYAPEAHSVRLGGEMSGGQTVDMVRRADSTWTFTTRVLAPDLYLYWLEVDGVRTLDVSNMRVIRDVQWLFNYIIIPDAADLYSTCAVPHGTVQSTWYHSAQADMDRRMTVYLPASYGEGKRRYPVLYLMHGSGGDEQAWIELGRTAEILDNSIARGLCREMIVVMTNGNISDDATHDHSAIGVQPGIAQAHRMDGCWEQSFGEVLDYVDAHYRTIPKASARAIAGLSMGGYHSYWISLNYAERFDYIGLFSAVYHRGEMTHPMYQDEADKLARLMARHPLYRIYIGRDDFLYRQNVDQRRVFDSLGYRYDYIESEGGHQWCNWRHYLSDFVTHLFR